MTEAFIVGLCVLAVLWGLVSGNGGRLMLIAGIVVGVFVGLAATLASTGTGLLASLGEMVARLGGSL